MCSFMRSMNYFPAVVPDASRPLSYYAAMAFDFRRFAVAQAEGKALNPHPAFMDRTTPVGTYAVGAAREEARLSQREAGRHMQAYGGKEAIDWVYAAVGLYSDTASTAKWHLEDAETETPFVRRTSRLTPPDYRAGPRDLYDLLDKPNPFMLYHELVARLVIDLLMVGNGYWYKYRTNEAGRPLAIYPLAPSHVRIIAGQWGPIRYEYQPPGAREPLKIPLEDVIHFKLPNPHDAYYGMGVISGVGRSIDLEIALTDTQASYYENKADPSLIIQSERRVSADVFRKLRAQLRARLSGARKSGELLVLEAGLRASTLTPSAREALFDTLTRLSRDRILAMFRASPKLFGIVDESGGSDRVTDARREFDTYVIRPFLDRLQLVITDALTAAWGARYVIDHSSTISEEELLKNASTIAAIPGIKVRDIRRLLAPLGLPESTGDPEIDEMVLNMPGEELDEDGQGGFADRPLAGEPGRPPRGENTRAFPRGASVRRVQGKALEDFATRLARVEVKAALEGKALTQEGRTTIGNHLPDEKAPSDPYDDERAYEVDLAAAQIRSALEDAARVLERSLLDTVEGKAFRASNVTGRVRTAAAWKTFREMVEEILTEGVKRSVRAAILHQADAGRVPDDEVDYDAVARSVIHRSGGLRSIVNTLRNRVAAAVKSEAKKDQPIQAEVQAALQRAIADWRTTQAETIALTEAVEGYNEGFLTNEEMLGMSEVYVTDGDEDDEPCIEANGQIWPIERAREHRTEHPRCRRAFLSLAEVSS